MDTQEGADINIRKSIAAKLLKVVFSLYFFLTATVTLVHMVAEYYQAKSHILEELQRTHKTFEPSLSTALWEFDDDNLQYTLSGLLKVRVIVKVNIIDNTGKSVIKYSPLKKEQQKEDKLFGYTETIEFINDKNKATKVGEMTLYSNSNLVIERVRMGYFFIIVNSVIKTAGLWIIFLIVSKYLLSRPLNRLIKTTKILDLNNLEGFHVDIGTSGQNELKILEDSFNTMFRKLHDGRQKLRNAYDTLDMKVKERTAELSEAKEQLEKAFEKAENERKAAQAANKKVMESIRYAENIQSSLLPNPEEVKTHIPDNFFIWMPRDIVGGDIFYTNSFEDSFVIAVIDCTGHGVPGAFMTMIACSGLKRIIKDEGCRDPALILNRLNFAVKTLLKQDTEHSFSDDGMDAAVCLVSYAGRKKAKTLTFAGAKIPLYYVYKGEVNIIKGDRQSIGYKRSDLNFNFTNHTISIEKGMSFYVATDGFADQLGKDGFSQKIRCFGKERLKKLLMENNSLSFEDQKKIFVNAFEMYRGEQDRQDDIIVIGFGFNHI